jgi:hypothetical protein
MLHRTRTLQTETLDVSVTGSATNVAGASATTSPSATLRELSRRSRGEYTLPLRNASCRSHRSHARLRAYALERSSPSSLKTPTSCGSTTESTSLLQPDPATTKPQVAASTTVPTVLELTSQPSQTVVAPTPADLHSATTATEKSSLTALRPAGAATIPTAAAATAAARITGPTGGLEAAADATRTAMIKQEQGETLRKYMRRFFEKRATVVDVTDKEVIDLFQDGLYHRRTFEDFSRRRPRSIPHLKDMITS